MRAFVTGGTGLVGRHLVDALLAEGWEVTVLTRDRARALDLEAQGVKVVEGDISIPTRFAASLAGADVLFHVAAWFEIGVREGRRMFDVNVSGTGNLLALARKEHIPRIVYTGTAGVYAPAPQDHPATEASTPHAFVGDPYVVTKVQAHRLVLNEMHSGLPVTMVLPATVFGPRDTNQLGRSLAMLVQGKLGTFPTGIGVNTFTHAADVAAGHLLAATKGKPGELYVLADRVLGMEEFFRAAAEAAGVAPPRRHVPMSFARFAARFSEAAARFRGRTPLLSRASLDFLAVDLAVDAAKARKELGWSPRRFEERMEETMAWYVEEYRERRAPSPVKPGGASA